MKILLVDDDVDLSKVITDWLAYQKFSIETATTAAAGRAALSANQYDLLILDWGLPDAQGIDFLNELRQNGDTTPVLMLTGKAGIEERVKGLDAGADDYLTKPFHLQELSSRIRAIARRFDSSESTLVRVGAVAFDLERYQLTVDGVNVDMTPKEAQLMIILMSHPGEFFSTDALIQRVWKEEGANSETLRSCVKRLRGKLGQASNIIESQQGRGYRITNPDS